MRVAEQVTFGGSGLDRCQGWRGDPAALDRAWFKGLALPFWRGRALVEDHPQDGAATPPRAGLVWLETAHPLAAAAAETRVLLGRDEGRPRWAIDISASLTEGLAPVSGPFDTARQAHPALPPTQGFADLRSLMADLSPRAAELAVTAKAVLEWHRSHSFCAACGQPSRIDQGGWQRACPACGATHFPRTDPVVIMLVTQGNRVLLGRGPGWPEGMYSLLAGFMEPGETIEAAVRREVAEETGVTVGRVGYLASQPWPFPASLMIGCRAEALDSEITLDPAELQDALWATREEIAEAFAGTHPVIRPSRRGSIAQFILNAWLADRLD